MSVCSALISMRNVLMMNLHGTYEWPPKNTAGVQCFVFTGGLGLTAESHWPGNGRAGLCITQAPA